ncbi:MAG TPA: ArsA family ATPase [Acidimicrobiia bacterium]|jgi:arsenite-transporting ATPase
MRIVLCTGKGGVGKTTVAAATALRCARRGLRTIVLSTDPAHSLADVFDVALGDDAREIAPRLHAQQLDARVRFEEAWADVRDYAVDVLGWLGAGAVESEELAVVPGLDEVFALADIKTHARSGRYDVVVVDCAPTAETLRLLTLPDVLGWYMDKLFARQRRTTRFARPLLQRLTSLPVAGDEVFAAIGRFYERLDGVRELLVDGEITNARIVVNPERLVVNEARRTYTYLSLFGYHVDAIAVNKVLPDGLDDPWFDEWRTTQKAQLEQIKESFAPLPILHAPLAPREVIGLDELGPYGELLYRQQPCEARLSAVEPMRVDAIDGKFVLSLHLPHVTGGDVELASAGDDLLVAVGPYRRALALPDSLRGRAISGARFDAGRLEVDFVPVRERR